MPTILIVTANDPADRLNMLSEEGKNIQRTLNSAGGRAFDVVLVPDTSITDLIEEFRVPGRVIEVLHFAGHADSRQLRFTDMAAEASALAEKIRMQGTVKLVFLNGCATRGQVRYFHQAGVPFVIATSRPVEDTKASWLATQIYQYLTLRRTLRSAMHEVVTDDRMLRKNIFPDHRGFGRLPDDDSGGDIEWKLYDKPGQEDADYNLPFSRPSQESSVSISHTVFLDELIFALEEVDSPALAAIKSLAVNIEKGSNVSDNKKITELLKVLPYTLGVRLLQITSDPDERSDDYYREMLYDYVVFFESLLHHTAALLMAQIWEDREITSTQKPVSSSILKDFLCQNRLNETPASYVPIIENLAQWLNAAGLDHKIPFDDKLIAYLHTEDFATASDFFFLQKQYFWQRIRLQENEAVENCFLAQRHLSRAFRHFNFIARFAMASVRSISVKNLRYVERKYDNTVSKLVVSDAGPSSIEDDDMMENKSVLCFSTTDYSVQSPSLNLFPFVIDRNVFTQHTNDQVDLYLFAGYFPKRNGENSCYHFISVQDPGKVWCFDETQRHASLLHTDEPASQTHEQNHLMANAGEFKKYLSKYKEYFIQA